METLLCDVIGCGRPAAWVRVENLESCCEDFLCSVCQTKLRRLQPREALHYIPCDVNIALLPPISGAKYVDLDGDDVIYIGA